MFRASFVIITKMYENLVQIGLRNYLDKYYDSKEWFSETYIEVINTYVGLKTDIEKSILLKKFESITSHSEANDHFNELMIGAAYHPKGIFQKDNVTGGSPDLVDKGISIEVKTINAPPNEIERHKSTTPGVVYSGPFPEDVNFENRFTDKFNLRLEKARMQINNFGLVYIVWDSTIRGWSGRKDKIEKLLNRLASEHKTKYPNITIKHIFFGDLREMLAARDTIKPESENN
jgi:hypothetical protein